MTLAKERGYFGLRQGPWFFELTGGTTVMRVYWQSDGNPPVATISLLDVYADPREPMRIAAEGWLRERRARSVRD